MRSTLFRSMLAMRSFTSLEGVATTRRVKRLAMICVWGCAFAALAGERVLEGLPGLDFSKLGAPAQKELATVFTDEFDYCGRPLTLAASLKKGDSCRHTKRMASLAASYANEGQPAQEIINQLAKYNTSFNHKRNTFKIDERTCKGAKDAKVTVVEFADFECPYCNAARPMMSELAKRPGVRVCYAAFPLSAHPNSVPAGQAALFARDAGKFWQMHDLLFENQMGLSEAAIKGFAKQLGLDADALGKAMAAGKYKDELEATKEAGKNAGVDSTPSVYVNGRKLTLGISMDSLSATVDDELDWVQGSGAWASN
ncbi:MAG: thioredoxin domain-containing protein [Myxococcaceae bacterium]|nr:thioredoxin domain-containing protein [Myxococcaceae bacterium]